LRLDFQGPLRGKRFFTNVLEWAEGEPGGSASENCGMISGSDGTWYDASCSEAKGYICESIRNRPPLDNGHRSGGWGQGGFPISDYPTDPDTDSDLTNNDENTCIPDQYGQDSDTLTAAEIAKVEACMDAATI